MAGFTELPSNPSGPFEGGWANAMHQGTRVSHMYISTLSHADVYSPHKCTYLNRCMILRPYLASRSAPALAPASTHTVLLSLLPISTTFALSPQPSTSWKWDRTKFNPHQYRHVNPLAHAQTISCPTNTALQFLGPWSWGSHLLGRGVCGWLFLVCCVVIGWPGIGLVAL